MESINWGLICVEFEWKRWDQTGMSTTEITWPGPMKIGSSHWSHHRRLNLWRIVVDLCSKCPIENSWMFNALVGCIQSPNATCSHFVSIILGFLHLFLPRFSLLNCWLECFSRRLFVVSFPSGSSIAAQSTSNWKFQHNFTWIYVVRCTSSLHCKLRFQLFYRNFCPISLE